MEEFRKSMKEAVMADPTRPVGQTYEAEMARMTDSLEGQDKEDFTALCPTFRAMERNLYRCYPDTLYQPAHQSRYRAEAKFISTLFYTDLGVESGEITHEWKSEY